ncbi:hypothetical protein GKC29_01305 [Micromonospora sp. WMMC415]|nr:hypothetical protein GKC29_01305 [Micromonospora sp. WMMC415]
MADPPPSDLPRAELRGLLEDVPGAAGYRYDTKDIAGQTMDTVKIVPRPSGGYLAFYHSSVGGSFHVSVATSTDLVNWTFRRQFGAGSSQPTVASAGNGFVVAWEQEPSNHLAFRYFPSEEALLTDAPARSFDAPLRLSACAEGTPNIYSVTLAPDIDHSRIEVGGHYFANCAVDRQQRGVLTNFSTWTTSRQGNYDNALLHWGVRGNIGDRDVLRFRGFHYGVVEGQYAKGDFRSWRTFLYDYQTGNADRTSIRTHGGSTAFANPTATVLRAPGGRPAAVFTLFIPSEGAAPREAGSLIYFHYLK